MRKLRKPVTARGMQRRADRFLAVRSPADFGMLVGQEPYKLELQALNPFYKVFGIPKSDGSVRTIEDPAQPLKACLKQINHYLQCCYHSMRPPAVHGFCVCTANEDDRNVVSNARSHLGRPFMLNMDLEDFFHTVTESRVRQIWERRFPHQEPGLRELLTGLVTYKGRLPMGAPSSPVLSNYAMLELDAELQQLASVSGMTYTRYADDLTFSSDTPVNSKDERLFREAIGHRGFRINEAKVRHYGESDDKVVTGIVVGRDALALPTGYTEQLLLEIDRLKSVMLVENRYRTGMSYKKLKLLKQELQGKINFAHMVLGDASDQADDLHHRFEEALDPPESYESAGWLEAPYEVW